MTDGPKPLTEEELDQMASAAEDYSLVAYPPMVRALIAEVRRLRALIRRAVGKEYVEGRYLGEPLNDGQCVWCQASIDGLGREPHSPTCPWPELVAVAEAERA